MIDADVKYSIVESIVITNCSAGTAQHNIRSTERQEATRVELANLIPFLDQLLNHLRILRSYCVMLALIEGKDTDVAITRRGSPFRSSKR